VAIFHQAITDKTAKLNQRNIEPESHIKIFGFSISKKKNTVQIDAKTKNTSAISFCATTEDFDKKNKIHPATADTQDAFQLIQSIQFIELIIKIIQKKSKLSAIK